MANNKNGFFPTIIKKTAELIPYARNSRTHSPEQVAQISASIREFGFTIPILIDADNNVIAGHGRIMAANKLGMTELPCIVATGWTDAQKKAYVIADNKLALNAGWDEEMLKLEFGELQELGFDLSLTGFSLDEIGKLNPTMVEGLTDEDAVPEAPEVPKTVLGDVWILGEHRVMCGDSTLHADFQALMAGDRGQMMFTDPPYNVDYEGRAGKIKNDKMTNDAFYEFLLAFHRATLPFLEDGGAVYVAHADTEGLNFRRAFCDAGLKLSGCLIWRKPSLVLGRSDYQWQHEPILYGWKKGGAHKFFGGRKQTTMSGYDMANFFQFNDDGSASFFYDGRVMTISGENLQVRDDAGSVFTIEKPSRSDEHPTMKPVELVEKYIKNSSAKGDVVLDAFGGSGSTLIACERTDRRCRMMELDEKYVDVIVTRWQNFTGKKATHAETGEAFNG